MFTTRFPAFPLAAGVVLCGLSMNAAEAAMIRAQFDVPMSSSGRSDPLGPRPYLFSGDVVLSMTRGADGIPMTSYASGSISSGYDATRIVFDPSASSPVHMPGKYEDEAYDLPSIFVYGGNGSERIGGFEGVELDALPDYLDNVEPSSRVDLASRRVEHRFLMMAGGPSVSEAEAMRKGETLEYSIRGVDEYYCIFFEGGYGGNPDIGHSWRDNIVDAEGFFTYPDKIVYTRLDGVAAPVPLPAAFPLALAGFAGLGLFARRRG